nr:hypothetical protein [Candidatus Sigynarchaeota archaeon]
MAQPDDLNYKMELAVQLLEDAEKYELAGDLETAIKGYEEAAHLLSQSGFPGEKISEIYDRISSLKRTASDKGVQDALSKEQEKARLEEEAFACIDAAEVALKGGKIAEAVQFYTQAIPCLEQSGYSTQHVKDKLVELSALVPKTAIMKPVAQPPATGVVKPVKPAGIVKPVKPAGIVKPVKPAGAVKPSVKPPLPDALARSENAEITGPSTAQEEKFTQYKESRAKIEEMEVKAFQLIDEAKKLTGEEKYSDALAVYTMIKTLLKNAGWSEDQIEPIEIQETLVKDIMREQAVAPGAKPAAPQAAPVMGAKAVEPDVPRVVKEKLDLMLDQDARMRSFKETRGKQQNVEGSAFDLINEAQKLYKFTDINRDYLGAVKLYEEAIHLLKSAGWLDQVPYLEAEVSRVKDLYVREMQAKEMEREEEQRLKEEEEVKLSREVAKQQMVENNVRSISEMLGKINAQQKQDERIAEEESIKQQLIEEKRLKTLIARTNTTHSFDSLKEMLFSNKDAKAQAEREAMKKRLEQEFLSNTSKRFFEQKKAEMERQKDGTSTVAKIVDMVHKEALASKQQEEHPVMGVVDLKKRQEQEVRRMQEDKDKAVGDVLSMLGTLKAKQAVSDTDSKSEKEVAIKDDELKSMFAKLKEKKGD